MAIQGVKVTATRETLIVLALPVPPNTNQRKKAAIRKRTNPKAIAVKGLHYAGIRTTKEVQLYQQRIREICLVRKVVPLIGEVAMQLTWYRAARRGDIVDRWKDLCDGLQTKYKIGKHTYQGAYGAYIDDSQNASFKVTRNDSEPRDPRVIVSIWAIGEQNGQ